MSAAAYEMAARAIRAGQAKPHHLWMLLSRESDRNGYALKPVQWEGPGEYQRVVFDDGRDVLVRLPRYAHLPDAVTKAEGGAA